jgi:hypothetical protein
MLSGEVVIPSRLTIDGIGKAEEVTSMVATGVCARAWITKKRLKTVVADFLMNVKILLLE